MKFDNKVLDISSANWKNPPRQDPLPGQPAPPKRGPNCGYPPGEAPPTK